MTGLSQYIWGFKRCPSNDSLLTRNDYVWHLMLTFFLNLANEVRGVLDATIWRIFCNMCSKISKRPRVLLADDSERMIQAVSKLLAEEFDVVGSVGDGEEAIRAACRLVPDVMVLDIRMPRLNGIRAAQILKEMNLSIKIVFLSGLEEREFVEAALAANGSAFVFKTCAVRDLRPAIREALAGRVFVSVPPRTRNKT
jgi:CheY-like chemotaxis protein